jgi:hypothetical protein
MGDKKDTKALAGLMEKYSRWKMNRLLASNNVPLGRYLARLGLITAYLIMDFIFLPSLWFDILPADKFGILAFGTLLLPVLWAEIKLLRRFS